MIQACLPEGCACAELSSLCSSSCVIFTNQTCSEIIIRINNNPN